MRKPNSPIILKSNLTTNYSPTTSFADIGIEIVIPEDGVYLLTGKISARAYHTTSTSNNVSAVIAVNGNIIPTSGGYNDFIGDANAQRMIASIPIGSIEYLKKGDVVTVQGKGLQSNCDIYATVPSNGQASVLEAVKIG